MRCDRCTMSQNNTYIASSWIYNICAECHIYQSTSSVSESHIAIYLHQRQKRGSMFMCVLLITITAAVAATVVVAISSGWCWCYAVGDAVADVRRRYTTVWHRSVKQLV